MRGGRLLVFAAVTASLGSACTSPREQMRERLPMVDAMTNGKLKGAVPARVADTTEGKKEPVSESKPWKIGDVTIHPISQGKGADYLLEEKPLNIPKVKAKPRL